jgi:hypothetical protein
LCLQSYYNKIIYAINLKVFDSLLLMICGKGKTNAVSRRDALAPHASAWGRKLIIKKKRP